VAISFVNRGTEVTGSTSVAPGYPAGLAAGDLLVLTVNHKATSVTPATPTGFTFVGRNASVSGMSTVTWVRESDGTETGTVSVTGLTSSSTGVIVAYRGVSVPAVLTDLLMENSTSGSASTAQVLKTAASIGASDTFTTDQWIVWCVGSIDDSWPITGLSCSTDLGLGTVGTVQRRTTDTLETATGTDNALSVMDVPVTSGATLTRFRMDFTHATASNTGAVVLLLTPAGAPAPSTSPRPVLMVTQQARIRSNLY
jgi:hypothetical protein